MALRTNMNPSANSFSCSESGCKKTFSRKDNLYRHLKNEHGVDGKQGGRFACSQCEDSFYHATKLASHMKSNHQVDISM